MKEITGKWTESLHDMVLKAVDITKVGEPVFFTYNNMKVTVEIMYEY